MRPIGHSGSFSFSSRPAIAGLRRAILLLLLLAAQVAGDWTDAPVALAQAPDEEIVYIDPGGVLRVTDNRTPAGRLPVTWFSPTGGYVAAALIDANRDGDLEIVALRNAVDNNVRTFRLDLYDPVITSGVVDPDQTVGGIPWRLLYSLPLAGAPVLVAAGNLDPSAPGEEILLSVRDPAASPGDLGAPQQLSYLFAMGPLDGTSWQSAPLALPREAWTSVATGNMDATGTDEVALVDSDDGLLQIWRVNAQTSSLLYENESNDRRWNHIAFGMWRGDGRDLLAGVRRGAPPLPTLFMFRLSASSTDVADDFNEAFAPGPEYVFFGDVNASGDDEVFMLRSAPGGDTTRARLIGRNRGNDVLTLTEDALTPDNGFRVGAAGDIDGDGRDEVVIMRSDRLRIYDTPESTVAFREVPATTNAQTILIGDLDRIGYVLPLRLAAAPTTFTRSASAGDPPVQLPLVITARPGNATAPVNIQAVSTSAPGDASWPPWLGVFPTAGVTPFTTTVTFDPSRLRPGGYTADLRITSSNQQVYDQPLVVPVAFNITAGLLPEPGALVFRQLGCPPGGGGVSSATVQISAPAGTPYQASLLATTAFAADEETSTDGAAVAWDASVAAAAAPSVVPWPSSVPWASATSPTGAAPETLTVTVDFAQRTADFSYARLILSATVNGVQQLRTVPIALLCAASETFQPFVSR
jgi:hypothetical protein